jgi:hypothetical protein
MVLSMSSATAPVCRRLVERSAGRLVGRLGPEGYVVGSDGVVVGPTGVSVIVTLAYADRLRIHQGELWHGRFPCRPELAAARRHLEQVCQVVDRFDPDLPVRWFACVVGSSVPDDAYCTLDVDLCSPVELPDRILAAPSVLGFDEVLALAHDLAAARRRRSGWRSSRRRLR